MKINLLRKIRNRGLNYILPIYYKIKPVEWGLNTLYTREKKVIVSLTSIPSRFDKITLCIESLMRQTYKPDQIILYLGKEKCNENSIPTSIKEMKNKGLRIEFREDLKPHTKYYYAIKENPNDIIITVDDDIYYHRTLIEELIKSYKKYPNAISCMRAHTITFDDEKNIKPYNEWIGEDNSILEPSYKLVATGVGGVLYPPYCMKDELFKKENIIKLSFKADDIWLKFIQMISNTKVVIANPRKTDIVVIKGTQDIALHKANVSYRQNDEYINNLIKYYKINIYDTIKTEKLKFNKES